jgi:ketosteroid isomerase-like protein
VATQDRLKLVRDCYAAYESGDRRVIEELLSDDVTFYSPPDPGIDRATYFERCWPNSQLIESFEFKRLVEAGDEVVVTYESTKTEAVSQHRGPHIRRRQGLQNGGLLRLGPLMETVLSERRA